MNNKKILLVSENYLKDFSTVMENVEMKFIKIHILESQDIHIQNILGTNLYRDIISQFEDYKNAYDAGTTGITASDYVDSVYLTLVDDYIQPCLKYYTLYESIYDLYAKITNKGIVNQTSDNSSTVSEEFLDKKRADYLNKAEFYSQRISNYLIDNQSSYPKYLENDGDLSDMTPDNQAYGSNGWYLKSNGSCGLDGYSRFREI